MRLGNPKPVGAVFWAGIVAVSVVSVSVGLVGGAVLAAHSGPIIPDWAFPAQSRPVADRYFINPESSAARAVPAATDRERFAFSRIANTPMAVWLTPERHDANAVTTFVRGIVQTAGSAGTVPVFVVYGIPDRDCVPKSEEASAGQSGGGLSDADYPRWVSAIADGLGSARSVVLLEPDSLALSVGCGNSDKRVSQISAAIRRLSSGGAVLYLDGGHSRWLTPEVMAGLLKRAGVSKVRGFVSNVSNFNTTAEEISYDDRISARLGGTHYVIDTSRNGNGSNGLWCNPTGRTLGSDPTAYSDGRRHDANLWVKNPGESDGLCNGGPAAGAWWPKAALEYASRSIEDHLRDGLGAR